MSTVTESNELLVPDDFPMAPPIQNADLVLPACLDETAIARYDSAASRAELVKDYCVSGMTTKRDYLCARAYANKLGEMAISDTPYAMPTNEALAQQVQALVQQVQALVQQVQAIHAEMNQRFGDLDARVLNAAAFNDESIVRAVGNPPEVQFPTTRANLRRLPAQRVNALLVYYNLETQGSLQERRSRLSLHLGVPFKFQL